MIKEADIVVATGNKDIVTADHRGNERQSYSLQYWHFDNEIQVEALKIINGTN